MSIGYIYCVSTPSNKNNIIIGNQSKINDQINISDIKKILLEQEKKIIELAEINKTISEKLFA
jgi:hypothetical protein